MQNRKILALSVLAVVLLSCTFISLVSAQEVSAPPDPSRAPDATVTDQGDNMTSANETDPVLYALDDNSTAPLIAPGPDDASGAEENNLIATQTDNTALVAGFAAVIVAVVGISGFLFFRYRAKNNPV
jgi:hypothetical protein